MYVAFQPRLGYTLCMALSKKTSKPTAPSSKKSATKASSISSPVETSAQARVPEAPMMSAEARQKRMRLYVGVGLLLVALYYFRGMFVVTLVNGKPITRYEVMKELEKQGGKGVVDNLIAQKLVLMEADAKGVSITDEAVAKRIATIEKDLTSSGQKLDDLLKAQGLTRDDVVKQTRLQLTLKELLKNKTKVTEAEVMALVEEQKEAKPEGVSDAEFSAQVRESLEQQKFATEVQSYIESLREKAQITQWHAY